MVQVTISEYITYALVPIFSCLYFDPDFTVIMSVVAYISMAVSVYFSTATDYEVIYLGKSHLELFIAYLLGLTIEFVVVGMILIYLVKRARKLMEERNSAEEQNKMKSRFLSNMSHEIRTPMNAILGMADVALRDGKNLDEETKKCLSVIKTSSTGLLEIINDILDMSKIEAGKLNMINEPYSTDSLIEEITVIINARNADKNIPIYYHIDEKIPPYLEGDAVRIKQIMFNFASNAIKYTDSGKIDITLGFGKEQDGYVNLTYTVKYTGIGIHMEDIDKIFEMYSRVDEEKNHSKEGTGIGLAISKYFIDEMNGKIKVESEYGKGSSFSFTIPQKVVGAPEKPLSSTETVVVSECENNVHNCTAERFVTKDVNILLVDDNEINRDVAKAMLEPLEADIDEADDGVAGVQMAEKKKYDIIFMDSHMPVMNARKQPVRSVLLKLRRTAPQL